jgi:hypothetical protein
LILALREGILALRAGVLAAHHGGAYALRVDPNLTTVSGNARETFGGP